KAARYTYVATAQRTKSFGKLVRLGKANVERREQGFGRLRSPAPGAVGALRDTGVNEDELCPRRTSADDEIGPKIRIDEESDVGTPMRDEAPRCLRRINGHELVDGVSRQTRLHEPGRRDSSARHKHV